MEELKIDKEFYDAFKKLLLGLKDYNKEIVIIGGLANALYQYHEHGQNSRLGVLATKDLDVLTSDKVTILNKSIIDGLSEQGFVIDPKPVGNKIITKFTLPETNFEIEFLCPMKGGDPDREGKWQLVKEIQDGITAQPLRYLDLALFDPWIINSRSIPELNDIDIDIQVPNPGAYLIQKFIIKDRRRPAFAQKDCFYIYELLLKFRDNFDIVKKCIDNLVVKNTQKGGYRKVKGFKEDFKDYFASTFAEGTLRCHRELRERGYDSIEIEDVQAVFDLFLEDL